MLKILLGKDLGICGSDAYLHLLPPHSVKFISMHTILGMIKGITDLLQPVLSIIQDGNLAKDLNANISLLLKGLLKTNLNTEKSKRIAQDQLKYRQKHKSTQFLHTIFINWSGKSFKALDLGEYDIKSLNQLASAWLKNTPPSALHPPTHQALYHQPRPFRAKI